jgi:small subunit ribosomal protein S15
MLDQKKKLAIISKFKTHDNDTGSPQVQVAILTEEIKELTEHLKTHKKDFSSRRGLFRKVNLRRKLLKFLEKTELQEYENLIQKLKLKRRIVEDKTDIALEEEPILPAEEEVEEKDENE